MIHPADDRLAGHPGSPALGTELAREIPDDDRPIVNLKKLRAVVHDECAPG
jgi:hypothetical protein